MYTGIMGIHVEVYGCTYVLIHEVLEHVHLHMPGRHPTLSWQPPHSEWSLCAHCLLLEGAAGGWVPRGPEQGLGLARAGEEGAASVVLEGAWEGQSTPRSRTANPDTGIRKSRTRCQRKTGIHRHLHRRTALVDYRLPSRSLG